MAKHHGSGSVLVTGATGFIGSHALRPLQQLGFRVYGVSRHTRADTGIPHFSADLRDAAQTDALLRELKPTHVLHCAWDVTHGRFWRATENLDWILASLHLAQASIASGVSRFVGVGSGAEYDWSDGSPWPRKETDPVRAETVYGTAKTCTATLLQSLFDRAGVGFAWARVFDLFGDGEPPTRLIPSVMAALRSGQPAVCRHGQLVRDYLPVEEVGRALAYLVASDVTGPVNIAAGQSLSLGELTTHIAGLLGRRELLEVQELPAAGQPLVMRADVTRLRREVGAPPPESLDQALKRLTLPC